MAFKIENDELKEYVNDSGETDVVIPDGIRVIGWLAFCGHDELKSVHIPDTVREIHERAFEVCRRLFLYVPPTVEVIGDFAFEGSGILLKAGDTEVRMAMPDSRFSGHDDDDNRAFYDFLMTEDAAEREKIFSGMKKQALCIPAAMFMTAAYDSAIAKDYLSRNRKRTRAYLEKTFNESVEKPILKIIS